jgi:formylglycine-generating enzyme required for sulfatase activity
MATHSFLPEEVEGKDRARMVLIPAGEFWMGSSVEIGKDDEHPLHRIWVDAFYIDEHEVTLDQYDRFCAATRRKKVDDAGWGRGDRPVINITWFDAAAYCNWAGKRLPTEAEWEKACRGGTESAYFFGNDASRLDDYAWYRDNAGKTTQPVKRKKPNPFGLFDMHGNVWEWCEDWYAEDYYAGSPERNPRGPESGRFRVLRGGSWFSDADGVRAGHRRDYGIPDSHATVCGFRCAKTP